jgi:4-amino-4-deoxy-L-arabinose transferase-like glycosyltransferase
MASGRSALRLFFIAIAALILYLPGLGHPALWEPDEGRYGEIAREMYLSGDFVTPRDNYVRYFEKPPLVYWAEAAAMSLFGAHEFAVRLPAALFSAGQVVIVAALADAMFDGAVAILAAVALALSPLFFGFARFATLDPALAFFMTAALGAFYLAARTGNFAGREGRRWFFVATAMLAFGTLAKGPVAPMLCGAIALLWMLIEMRAGEIPRIPWLSAIAIYFAITVPWFTIAAHRNPGFLSFFFVHEHLQRYLENTEHGWGPWFFLPVVFGGTWPWFFFVPLGLSGLRATPPTNSPSQRSELRFLVVWFLVIFVFFSVPRAKLGSYVLPAIPALAITAGLGLSKLWSIDVYTSRRMLGGFSAITLLASIAVALAIAVLGGKLSRPLIIDAYLIASLLAAIAVVSFIADRDGKRPGAFVITLALGMILVMGVAARTRKDAAPLTSYRMLATRLSSYLRPGCVFGSYRHNVQSLPFYTGYREALVSYRGELAPFGDGPDAAASFINNDDELRRQWAAAKCFALVVNRKDLPALATLIPPPVMIGCEGKKVALINLQDARPDGACTTMP